MQVAAQIQVNTGWSEIAICPDCVICPPSVLVAQSWYRQKTGVKNTCMKPSTTLFDKTISRPRRGWVTLGIALLLLLIPMAAAYVDGVLAEVFTGSQWRGMLIPVVVILYILLVAPRLGQTEAQVIESLRPIVLVDDDTFARLIREADIRPRNELLAIVAGMAVGLLMFASDIGPPISWSALAFYLSSLLMYGLLAWTIYLSVAGTRLINLLLRQPLHVDPFDISPFEAIGRQSLLVALVFVGGITLSLVFVAFGAEAVFLDWGFWLIYIPLVLVPVIIFFLSMLPTHHVLAAAKDAELTVAYGYLHRSFRELRTQLDAGQPQESLTSQINALSAYENRLRHTRTWPYNTGMLRTLFFSILVPAAAVLGRIIAEMLFD